MNERIKIFPSKDTTIITGGVGHTIENEGAALTQRANLNFIGDGVNATDNIGTDSTDITITGGIDVEEDPLSLHLDQTVSQTLINVTSKAILNDNDEIIILDSEDSNIIKKTTLADVYSYINVGGVTDYERILWVDPNGDDLTGSKGKIALPFATIETAILAAISGDLIIVNPGTYTITGNLAKDGINYYFHKGAICTKSSAGSMWDWQDKDISGAFQGNMISDINVYGYGTFNQTVTTDSCFIFAPSAGYTGTPTIPTTKAVNVNFEFYNMSAVGNVMTLGHCQMRAKFNIKFNKIECFGTTPNNYACIYMYYGIGVTDVVSYIQGNIATQDNTSSCLILHGAPFEVRINRVDNWRTFPLPQAYGVGVSGITVLGDYHIGACLGGLWGYNVNGGHVMNIFGKANSINAAGIYNRVNLYDQIDNITVAGASVECTEAYRMTMTSGTLIYTSAKPAELTVLMNQGYESAFFVSGGTLILNGAFFHGHAFGSTISGGTVIINDVFTFAPYYAGYSITLSGGTLIAKAKFISTNGFAESQGNYAGGIVSKTGGTLIIDGATYIKTRTRHNFVNAPNNTQSISIYHGGMSTNEPIGTLYSAKKRSDKILTTVEPATVTVTINGIPYSTTQPTMILQATELANLITTAAVVNVTYNPGDTFFIIEALTAGTTYTLSVSANLFTRQLGNNGYALTENFGGKLVENPNIT